MSTSSRILIVGGAGTVGRRTAETLRALYPELPITIGGRDLSRAEAAARALGHADAARVDLTRRDLGLGDAQRFGAVLLFVKDTTTNALAYAMDRGSAYVDISTGAIEVGPEMTLFARRPRNAPVVFASHWLAGAATLATLHFAREFGELRSIELAAVLDEQDMGGPAAFADFERQTGASPKALVRDGAHFRWIASQGNTRRFRDGSGFEFDGTPYALMDNLSLAAATGAASVRFDLALGTSSSRRRGEPFSTEIVIELEGDRRGGGAARARHELFHPQGQAPVTAAGVALIAERLLGLHGQGAVAPGLYTPDTLVDPAHAVRRFTEFGTVFRSPPA